MRYELVNLVRKVFELSFFLFIVSRECTPSSAGTVFVITGKAGGPWEKIFQYSICIFVGAVNNQKNPVWASQVRKGE